MPWASSRNRKQASHNTAHQSKRWSGVTMSGPEQATSARAQLFDKFALILRKGNPRDVRFYRVKMGGQDRMNDGAIIRARANDYELTYAPGLNLGRLHASLGVDGQRDLVSMAAHQMRREMPFAVTLRRYSSFWRNITISAGHWRLCLPI